MLYCTLTESLNRVDLLLYVCSHYSSILVTVPVPVLFAIESTTLFTLPLLQPQASLRILSGSTSQMLTTDTDLDSETVWLEGTSDLLLLPVLLLL